MTTADLGMFWGEEPAERAGHAHIRTRIGGLHCSLCTGTIKRAFRRCTDVARVVVSLTHEQALIEYDPQRVDKAQRPVIVRLSNLRSDGMENTRVRDAKARGENCGAKDIAMVHGFPLRADHTDVITHGLTGAHSPAQSA